MKQLKWLFIIVALVLIVIIAKPYFQKVPPTPVSNNTITQETPSNWHTYTDKELGFSFEYPSNWQWEFGGQADYGHFYCANDCALPNKDQGNNFVSEFSVSTGKFNSSTSFQDLMKDQRDACKDFYFNQSSFLSSNQIKVYEVCDEWWVESLKHNSTILVFKSGRGIDYEIGKGIIKTLNLSN